VTAERRRGYIRPQGCPHELVKIVGLHQCVHRDPHKNIHQPCSSEDVIARCQECGDRLEYFGWNDFDKRRPARQNGTLTEYGTWRLQKAVEPSQERTLVAEMGINPDETNFWRELGQDSPGGGRW
jgi:hypothetical protein